MEAFQDAMCACTDATCADKVTAAMETWRRGYATTWPPADLRTNMRRVRLARRIRACARSLQGGEVLDAMLEKLEAVKDAMCACADAACALKVGADLTAWSKAFATTASANQQIDEATSRVTRRYTKAMTDCADRAMGAGAAPTDAWQ
jgi:hypothetical protein